MALTFGLAALLAGCGGEAESAPDEGSRPVAGVAEEAPASRYVHPSPVPGTRTPSTSEDGTLGEDGTAGGSGEPEVRDLPEPPATPEDGGSGELPDAVPAPGETPGPEPEGTAPATSAESQGTGEGEGARPHLEPRVRPDASGARSLPDPWEEPWEEEVAEVPAEQEDELAVPRGTRILLDAESGLSSDTLWAGDQFYATVAEDVLAPDGMVLVPLGARAQGSVTEARRSSEDGDPVLEVRIGSLMMEGRVYDLEASVVDSEIRLVRSGADEGAAAKVAVGAAAGAILGKVLGGDSRSTVAGAVAGAAAGTAAAIATRRQEAVLEAGGRIVVELDEPLRLAPVDESRGGDVR